MRHLFLIAITMTVAAAQVRVWQGSLALPTSEEGAPDANPPFDQYASTQFSYPYTLRENITGRTSVEQWRAVYIENEYLKCSVLPDLGGHIYTCLDKLSGQPMFYANPSIKKARIGYRGAWAAFGVEFNFPVSHNWVSMSPVLFETRQGSDGSGTVKIANVDRVYGMEWTVELTLRPGASLLEERVTLYNRSDARHRFYWWDNAAVEVKNDARIIYPMRYSASHGFADVDTWPVDSSGIDLSVVANQTQGTVSRFAHGSREPFMGVYHPSTKTGLIHYSDFADLPAKKIWSWGVDADGLDWRKQLSDNNSGYVEVQAGLFRNQETYAFLEPRQAIRFTGYWMPVRAMSGFARATLDAVMNMTRTAGLLNLELQANRILVNASVRVTQDGRPLMEEKATLRPESPWRRAVAIQGDAACLLEVRDSAGRIVIRHQEGIYDWTPAEEIKIGPRPANTLPPPPARNADDWVQAGRDDELNGRLLAAMASYQNGLAAFPASHSLKKARGRLAAALLRYEEAASDLSQVTEADTTDPEAAYYLGLALDGLGRVPQARLAYESAARLPSMRAAATLKLAELLARRGERSEALRLLERIAGDARADEERALLTGTAAKSESVSPLLRHLAAPRAPAHLASLAGDADRVLQIAAAFMRLGNYQGALDVLSIDYPRVPAAQMEPGTVLPQRNPIVVLYRAYCRQKLGLASEQDDLLAETLSPLYVFPGGAATLEVLKAAVARRPESAIANWMLGTQLFAMGLSDPALDAWRRAKAANPRLPVVDASIGRALLHIRHDAEGALKAFRAGLVSDPANVEVYAGVDQALTLLRGPASARAQALESYPNRDSMPAELVYKLILNLSEAGRHEQAMELFRGRFFARQEGGTNVRQVWVEVRLQQALGLARAGRCADAVPLLSGLATPVEALDFTKEGMDRFASTARVRYLSALALEQCGKQSDAVAQFKLATQAGGSELAWAHRAATRLPAYDAAAWRSRLEAALERTTGRGRALLPQALLEMELGRRSEALGHLRESVLNPDRLMSLHLARLAMDELATTP